MIEFIYRLRCDQCSCFGPQGVTQQRAWEVAGQINWSVDPAAGTCLCAYCRPDGYAKGVQEGREAERERCLILINQMTDRADERADQVCRGDVVDLLACVRDGSQLFPE